MTNPLLSKNELPDFGNIKPEHFEPAIDSLLKNYMKIVNKALDEEEPNWGNTIQIMDEEYANLDFAWNVINHLNAVNNTKEVREAYEKALPKMTDFFTELGQNKDLYKLYVRLSKAGSYDFYEIAQKKTIHNAIRDYKLAGITLKKDKKDRLKAISMELSELSNNFEKNIIDATMAFSYHVKESNKKILDNLPKHTIATAKQKAKDKGQDGYILTLDAPCYNAIMSYCNDRSVREEFYRAFVSRASDVLGNKEYDNSKNIDKIVKLRQEKADLLGFENYAEYVLQRRMAEDTNAVSGFIFDLIRKSLCQSRIEFDSLCDYIKKKDKLNKIEPWDLTYYSTLRQKEEFDFDEEDLRPYFDEEKVFEGLALLSEKLFDIRIKEVKDFPKWHDSVKLFEVTDSEGNLRGKFYTDLFAREYKRSGAWMADLRSRMKYFNKPIMNPIAFLNCNFAPPSKGKPALLSHTEIVTLFHEFGHTLQHILTQVDFPSVAGISGIPWDAVELPSQFMENWCWEWDVISDLSAHFETGKKLPKSDFQKLIKVKNFQSAMRMMRQLEFALFDFKIHANDILDEGLSIDEILEKVRGITALMEPKYYNKFQNSFSHIFAGGYAAGYYSYKWAELLSADAFSKFEESDVKIDPDIGKLFRQTVLELGGSLDAEEVFIKFRGRRPMIDALLRHNGIES